MARTGLHLACFALHFGFVLAAACQDTFGLIGSGYTVLPAAWNSVWQQAESVTSTFVGQHWGRAEAAGRALRTYLHFAGIENGYGFFAPNVPNSYQLVFEFEYSDGRVDYEAVGADAGESNIRLSGLLDELGRTTSDPLREVMMKLLAHSIWQRHPDAIKVRAILGSLALPTVSEFRTGKTQSYQFLYAYDFSLTDPGP